MPLEYTEGLWQSLYNSPRVSANDPEPRIYYTRKRYEAFPNVYRRRLGALPDVAGLDVVVVGCGFGWLNELLTEVGASTVVGIDASPYVHENKDDHAAPGTVLVDAVVGVDDLAAALHSRGLPTSYDLVVDEDALSSNAPGEWGGFLDACEALLDSDQHERIIHLVTPVSDHGPGDSSIQWRTMESWSSERPDHTWVSMKMLKMVKEVNA